MPIESINPSNGELLRSFDSLTSGSLESKLALAAHASRSYRHESLEQRAFWMRRLALLLESDIEELATLITLEMGKTLVSARQEVAKCATVCNFYAENAAALIQPEQLKTEHAESYVRWDPLGVVLAVMPWNFPFWQVFRFLAPALMAGNVGLLKHAPNVPQCALAIESLVRRAGFPRGVFQSLLIEARQVEAVLGDDRIAAVTVTGSEAAGRAIAAQAGWLIKKTVLELGGSDPFIVLPSANLDEAVANAVASRTLNNGQSCIAAKRFLVHTDIYSDFERRFVENMAALRVGDPTDPDTQIGPLSSPRAADILCAQIDAALSAGGRLLTGGKRLFRPGNFVEPTVIAGVPRHAAVAREETFGPLALLFRIDSIDDAIALANDTPFGLAASCWTCDAAEQARLSRELVCGGIFFNAPAASDPRLPFGGTKRSGYGRELGAAGMREFMNPKTVVVAAHAEQTVAMPIQIAAVAEAFVPVAGSPAAAAPAAVIDETPTPARMPITPVPVPASEPEPVAAFADLALPQRSAAPPRLADFVLVQRGSGANATAPSDFPLPQRREIAKSRPRSGSILGLSSH